MLLHCVLNSGGSSVLQHYSCTATVWCECSVHVGGEEEESSQSPFVISYTFYTSKSTPLSGKFNNVWCKSSDGISQMKDE